MSRLVDEYEREERIALQAEGNRTETGLVALSSVRPESVSWLWYPYIPIGKVTLIEGDPGIGKSTVTLAVATAFSLGLGLPGIDVTPRGVTLLLSAEDGLADTVRPRLDAMGADLSRVFAIDKAITLDLHGCNELNARIRDCGAGQVVIDPLFAYFSAKVDIHKANETRAVMARLARISAERSCSMIGIRHLTKSGRDKSIYRGQGSIDLTASCRSVLLVGADPTDKRRRAVVQIKNNLAPIAPPVGYEIVDGRFVWTGVSDLTAERILAAENDTEGPALTEAAGFLREVLSHGPITQKQIIKEAREQGISERTLYRAKADLKVRSWKSGVVWLWELSEDCQSTCLGNVGKHAGNLHFPLRNGNVGND